MSSLHSALTSCSTFYFFPFPLSFHRRYPPRHLPKTRFHFSCKAESTSETDEVDVSRNIIQPSFRSTPWKSSEEHSVNFNAEISSFEIFSQKLRLLFVSESNVCRSILAECVMMELLKESGLDGLVDCESRATRDYNLGEGADPAVIAAAENLSIFLNEEKKAQLFDYEKDIVVFDLVLVMDKFTAADVLREISVYDTIQKEKSYSSKIRRLGEFHPQMTQNEGMDGYDIDDPLYGNYGGDETRLQVEKTGRDIQAACLGLLGYLQKFETQSQNDGRAFKELVVEDILQMECIDWLVPPMLQSK